MAKLTLSTDTANDVLNAINNRLNAGSGAAKFKPYTGTMPATPNVAITSQVRLGTLTCSDPAATVSGRTMTFGAIAQDDLADATGTATWGRFEDSDGNAILDVDITTIGGGGVCQMPTTSIYANTPITAPSAVLTA